jgi:HNH endonuclease
MSTPTAIFTKQSHVTGYVLRAAIREQVLTRAGWRCQACGLRRRLDVHHVAKRAQGGSDFDLNLLVALCRWCHDQTDAPYERGAARGDPVGRRSVYVRGRRAGGTWHSPGRGSSICPRGQKLSPSTITVARPRSGNCGLPTWAKRGRAALGAPSVESPCLLGAFSAKQRNRLIHQQTLIVQSSA